VNGLEIGAALTGLAALVSAVFGGLVAMRQASNAARIRDDELEAQVRRILDREREVNE
jgi:hypothetical protein